MATTSDIRNGLIIEYKSKLWEIVEFLHVKPGKGGAFVRTKLKNVQSGQVVENTFRAGEKIEPIRVEAHKLDYLYSDEDFFHFMNSETFEQLAVAKESVGDNKYYLLEGTQVKIKFREDDTSIILGIELPTSVNLKITECEPNVKGNSASTSYKTGKTETGMNISIPFFIEEGNTVKVDTRTGKYLERIKD